MNYLYYIKKMNEEIKEKNTKNVVNWAKKSLKKHYSEKKLHELEIAVDIMLSNEF